MKVITIALCALIISANAAESSVTAINGGSSDWSAAPWSEGAPGTESTVFLNSNTELTIPERTDVQIQGFRIGNLATTPTRLLLTGGNVNVLFVVLADAPNAWGELQLTSGLLTVTNTRTLDFELGNPLNSPSDQSQASATFSGGVASLADIRFNLRPLRELKFTVAGSEATVSCSSLVSETAGIADWIPAKLCFVFDSEGVSSLRVSGKLELGDRDRFIIEVDGSAYKGREKRFRLVDATSASGSPASSVIKGFGRNTIVAVEDGDLVLIVP